MESRSAVPELTLGALGRSSVQELPLYLEAMRAAYTASPAPYGMKWYGDLYRSCAAQPGWLETSLVANADKEGFGSRKLWELSAACDDRDIAEQVRLHAIDESRHALYYIALLRTAFPNSVDENAVSSLQDLSPGYRMDMQPNFTASRSEERVIDELVQMNIGEIRTRINQLLLRPVISVCSPPHRQQRVIQILDTLLADETRHIKYTARIIESVCKDPKRRRFATEVFHNRVAEFNQITLQELGVADAAFD